MIAYEYKFLFHSLNAQTEIRVFNGHYQITNMSFGGEKIGSRRGKARNEEMHCLVCWKHWMVEKMGNILCKSQVSSLIWEIKKEILHRSNLKYLQTSIKTDYQLLLSEKKSCYNF